MSINTIVTIHGFLGSPHDFAFLNSASTHHIDLFGKNALQKDETKEHWLIRTGELLKQLPSPRLVVGYSLGARIALELTQKDSALFSKLVLISCNPGLTTNKERQSRLEHDTRWSRRFLSEPLKEVLADWNKQPVFSGSTSLETLPSASRELIAQTLSTFSLAHQTDFTALISSKASCITWITGEKDKKFVEIATSLKQKNPDITTVTIKGAGHRVIFDQALEVKRAI